MHVSPAVLLVVGLLIVIVIAVAVGTISSPRSYPYRKAGPLLSQAEQAFFRMLHRAMHERYAVWCKVRVADVIKPKAGLSRKTTIIALNRIAAKHVDFVLVDRQSFEVIAALELDDRSHQRADRLKRDTLLNGAFKAAGVPLIRVKARGTYAVGEIQALVTEALALPADSERKPARTA